MPDEPGDVDLWWALHVIAARLDFATGRIAPLVHGPGPVRNPLRRNLEQVLSGLHEAQGYAERMRAHYADRWIDGAGKGAKEERADG